MVVNGEDRQLGNIWTEMEIIKEYLVEYTRIKRNNNHSNSSSGCWFLVLSYDLMFNLFDLHDMCNVPVSERSKLRPGEVKSKITCQLETQASNSSTLTLGSSLN